MSLTITSPGITDTTQIPNKILSEYILSANGNHIKVYLYLQMMCQHPIAGADITVDAIAERLDFTENDVRRSLKYWEKNGLISVSENEGGDIDIRLLSLYEEVPAAHLMTPVTNSDAQKPLTDTTKVIPKKCDDIPETESKKSEPTDIPKRHDYDPTVVKVLARDVDIESTLSAIEQILGTVMSPAHMQLIVYLMCELNFKSDLVKKLYETALSRGKTAPRYIEKIAIDWASKGITSPDDAADEAASHDKMYLTVKKAFGLDRAIAPAERKILGKWCTYNFSEDIIAEACDRTVLSTGDISFAYASKILSGWHEAHVKDLEDIKKLDNAHKRVPKVLGNTASSKKTKGSFHDFNQRDYSDKTKSLEKTLLKA